MFDDPTSACTWCMWCGLELSHVTMAVNIDRHRAQTIFLDHIVDCTASEEWYNRIVSKSIYPYRFRVQVL